MNINHATTGRRLTACLQTPVTRRVGARGLQNPVRTHLSYKPDDLIGRAFKSALTVFTARLLPLVLLLCLPTVLRAQFTFETNNGALTITGYTGPGGAVIIPSETNGLQVTSIGNSAFESYPIPCAVTTVTIPGGVTNIGSSAFIRCPNLASVLIPSSVIRIGDSAFNSCISLTNITIPDGVSRLDRSTFYNCTSLVRAEIGIGVTNLSDGPFSACPSLVGIYFHGNAPRFSGSSSSSAV